MHLVRRFLAVAIGLCLAATALAWVADASVWNTKYLTATATDTGLATTIAASLPDVIGSFVPDANVKAAVVEIVTPEYVEGQLGQVIPAFVEGYRHGGTSPTLNLTDINDGLVTRGLAVPESLRAVTDAPLPLAPAGLNDSLHLAGTTTGQLHWLAPLAALVGMVLVVVLAPGRRLVTLAWAAGFGAVFTALAAAFTQAPPQLAAAALGTSVAKSLAPAVRGFVQTIANYQTHQLLLIAAALLGVAVVLVLAHAAIHATRRFRRNPDEAKERA